MKTPLKSLPTPAGDASRHPGRSMRRLIRNAAAATTCALAATFALAAPPAPVEHVGINAERGDPARWYVPADTPRRLYDTQVKEAGAARGEQLKDCRAMQADRSACIAEANALYRRDLEDARSLLARNQGGAVRGR